MMINEWEHQEGEWESQYLGGEKKQPVQNEIDDKFDLNGMMFSWKIASLEMRSL